ncbi:SAM domain-containing protein SAMSN-1b isoform X2 [Poeciliopsis prolifica]|uniref:SAM domain-containing protein SAMSN-1b isoform X2 n=1 Tax=Poeciliopsis prolifica TaxID=188132 RepID=UPI0024132A67|nr:SAM domain-containing protein SAMSN-1b isoform X2 [Poeciliopsis prolifica]
MGDGVGAAWLLHHRGVSVCLRVGDEVCSSVAFGGLRPWLSNMNLFCFMLDGSTESIYEPASSHTNGDVSPKSRCGSGHLRCKPEWGGSDPSISSDKHQTRTKPKEDSRRSRKPMEDETFACSGSSALTGPVRIREPASERKRTDPPAQPGDPAETTGRLKKFQKLVHIRNGLQTDGAEDSGATKTHDCLADGVRHNGTVLTCIGLSRRMEKSSSKAAAATSHPLPPHQNARRLHGDPTEGGFWSPKTGRRRPKTFECPHARHRTPGEPCTYDGIVSSPPRSSEWDRFESLVRELDRNQSDLSLSRMIRSLTDLQLSQNNGKQEKAEPKQRGRETETGSDSKDIDGAPEETRAARVMQNDEAAEREAGRRRSRNSLESLYSLKSGQSSSSGVTSGSNCSSNRESLRLEDDPASARRFCCQARVHTEFVPSPYDTESLALKVGDVIDVIAKPPMGTWTGSLNGRTGNFKFIYVDVLTHPSGTTLHEASQRSTVQEALRRLGLEERASSPQRGGHQAVDDPMELNVTRPERRERPLAAVNSLQLLRSNSLAGGESSPEPERSGEYVKEDVKSRPRDSGCVMTEDAQPHFLSDGRT